MKRFFKQFSAFLLILVFIVSVTACGSSSGSSTSSSVAPAPTEAGQNAQQQSTQQQAAPAEKIKLSFWAGDIVGPDEQKLSQDQWYIAKAIKRFEQANPDITVEFTVEPDSLQAHQTFKAAAMAKNGPDAAEFWSGMYLFALKDALTVLDGKVPKEDLDNITGWNAVRENFKPDGAILGYPNTGPSVCCFYYNKKLVKAAGLDFDSNPPRTADDFLAALEKIKATGVIPIVSDEGNSPSMIYYVTNYWWCSVTGVDGIQAHNRGETKFADDKGLLQALKFYRTLYEKGYINKDTLSSKDSQNRFLQGKAAMIPDGSWAIDTYQKVLGDDVGAIIPPNMPNATIKDKTIGGSGGCFSVANYTKYVDQAVKFLSFLDSKPELIEYMKTSSCLPLRKDIAPEEVGWDKDALHKQFYNWSLNTIYWVGNSTNSAAMSQLIKFAPIVLVGKMKPEELLAKMDEKFAEANKK